MNTVCRVCQILYSLLHCTAIISCLLFISLNICNLCEDPAHLFPWILWHRATMLFELALQRHTFHRARSITFYTHIYKVLLPFLTHDNMLTGKWPNGLIISSGCVPEKDLPTYWKVFTQKYTNLGESWGRDQTGNWLCRDWMPTSAVSWWAPKHLSNHYPTPTPLS